MYIILQFILFIWILSVSYSVFTEWLLGMNYRKSIEKVKRKIEER